MRFFAVFLLSLSFVFPAFSQSARNPNADRFRALGEIMGTTLEENQAKLNDINDQIQDNGKSKNYSDYREQFNFLTRSMRESEIRVDELLRTNARPSEINRERDVFESLVKKLGSMKADYDQWLRAQ